jgi:hypothetical protein
MFPETPWGAETMEEIEAIFEYLNGLIAFGSPAWKTRVQAMQTFAIEHGDIETAKAHAVTSETSGSLG